MVACPSGQPFAFEQHCLIAIGLIIASATMRFMSAILYGVSTDDPMTYFTITCAVMIAALLACYLPSRRAADIDPVLALRG